jgi:hypothetical protein
MRKILVLLIGVTLLFSCGEDSVIGSELVDGENIDVVFTDDVPIKMQSVLADTSAIFTIGENTSTDLRTTTFGRLDDPFFGVTETTIYTDVHFNSINPTIEDGATIDSVVLSFPLDTIIRYANEDARHRIEIYPLLESLTDLDTFRTTTSFDFDPSPLAIYDGVINPFDSVFVNQPEGDTLFRFIPLIRMQMQEPYLTEFVEAFRTAEDDDAFIDLINGFAIKSFPDDNSLMSFNMSNTLASLNDITIYYTQNDTIRRYEMPMGVRRFVNYDHTFEGSQSEQALNNYTFGDSLVFLQGMRGFNVEIDISAFREQFGDQDISYGELEFFGPSLMGDDLTTFSPIETMTLAYRNEDGNLVSIEDFTLGQSIGSSTFFGGIKEEVENNMIKYNLSITHHLVEMLNDDTLPDELFLIPLFKTFTANRGILYGPGHSEFPARLKLITINP